MKFWRPERYLGTEERPHIVNRNVGTPHKYQCVDCQEWYVEPQHEWFDRAASLAGSTQAFSEPRCKTCHERLLRRQWESIEASNLSAWSEYK